MDEKLSTMQTNLFAQFSSMIANSSKQFEGKCSKLDDRLDRLGSSQFCSDLPSQENYGVGLDVS